MRRIQYILSVTGLALVLILTGCESSGGGGYGDSSGTSSGSYSTRRPGSGGGSFSAGEKATMDAAWAAYRSRSPGWPALRERWIALGPEATDVLLDNLMRAFFAGWFTNTPEEAQRARMELIMLGPAAVPTVTGMLKEPTYHDPATRTDERLSSDIVNALTGLLLVAEAEPQLVDLARSDVASVRRAAISALGKLGSPRGVDMVVNTLRRSGDWMDRVTAAKALGASRTPDGREALVAALRDRDDLVNIEAARSLAVRRDRSVVGILDARREEARAAGNHRIAAAMGAAAKSLREGR